MSISVNHNQAKKVLIKALREKKKMDDDISSLIDSVLYGTHKTYKYILVTGLLAKAVDKRVDTIALQAKAPLKGAYDARSLCHRVIVPFERDFLNNALGGSNEPFLNKPARFQLLSKDNAVRAGRDREILLNVIKIFQRIYSTSNSYKYLCHSIHQLEEINQKNKEAHKIDISRKRELIDIYAYIMRLTERSCEGEVCTVIIASIEKQFYSGLKDKYEVKPHNVNQSGSSSKEIGDIDVYHNDKYLYSIEVKDKDFTEYDIEFAFNKIVESSGSRGAFIYGPRAKYNHNEIQKKLKKYEEDGFAYVFADILTYTKIILFKTQEINYTQYIKIMMDVAIEINTKEITKKWIIDSLNSSSTYDTEIIGNDIAAETE